MCVSDKVVLVSSNISRNFAKILLCMADMANLAKIFERS